MTDSASERSERLRRLQERRAATRSVPDGAGLSRRPRRRHPAAATRWVLAGLSVASFFTIGGAVAAASRSSGPAPSPVVASADRSTAAIDRPQGATPAAPSATPAPAPHTTTQGS